jgi:hypothetical protein
MAQVSIPPGGFCVIGNETFRVGTQAHCLHLCKSFHAGHLARARSSDTVPHRTSLDSSRLWDTVILAYRVRLRLILRFCNAPEFLGAVLRPVHRLPDANERSRGFT